MKLRAVALSLLAALTVGACAADGAASAGPDRGARAGPPTFAEDAALQAAIAGDWRPAAHKARDPWRHPYESLQFWGLRPGMTVVEVDPGGEAWWTQILAPYAAQTGGRYVAAMVDPGTEAVRERAAQARAAFPGRFADPRYGRVTAARMTTAGIEMEPNSADMILVARAFHNWARREGWTDQFMAGFFRALKPGGVLAVEQHRLPAGVPERPESGYVSEQYVIDAARRAGFVLDARSDVNANPNDDTDHPFGVWTLPPVRRNPAAGEAAPAGFDRATFDAIGESDRMTLRFRKPG